MQQLIAPFWRFSMQCRQFMTKWHNDDFEGYLFGQTSSARAIDFRIKARKLRQQQNLRDWMEASSGILVIILFAIALCITPSMIGRAGLVLLLAASMAQASVCLFSHLRQPAVKCGIPLRAFLLDTQERLRKRILTRRRLAVCSAVPLLAGGCLYVFSLYSSPTKPTAEIAVVTALFAVIQAAHYYRARSTLLKYLTEIDRLLTQLDQNPA